MVAPPPRLRSQTAPAANLTTWWSTSSTSTTSSTSSSPTPNDDSDAATATIQSAAAAVVAIAFEPEVTQAAVNSYSSVDVAVTIMTLFALWPLITCGNCLLLAAFHRYKRLRTPSNCLVASLAAADTGVGIFLPLGIYFELTKASVDSAIVCLLPYSAIITICGVSILSMTAIALDRYTSLARPLRYNNLITKTSVGRYVSIFWIYALMLGASPIVAHYAGVQGRQGDLVDQTLPSRPFVCSFDVVGQHVRIFLFCMLFAPCACVLLFSYAYVYIVARYHAHAIYSVELSVRQNHQQQQQRCSSLVNPSTATGHHPFHPRYGWTLAITVGFFLVTWTPFQVCMLMDAFRGDGHVPILQNWTRVYLAFIAFANSALNPWVYGYRNTEFRHAFQRILEDLFSKVGLVKKGDKPDTANSHNHHNHRGRLHDRSCNGDLGLNSCASNVRLCVSPNHLTMTTLLKPTYIQAQESTSYGGGITNGEAPTTTMAICETVISSVDFQ